MKIDITSMFFNSKIEGQTATPAWGTSIGQNKSKGCRIDDFKQEVVDMVIGMTYKSISDRENLDVSKGSSDRDIIICSVFNDVYINNQRIDNVQYVLLLVREHSKSHDGRLLISYAPYIKYRGVTNQDCINKMQNILGCNDDGCWFVYEISIKNQAKLYFSAVVVNPTSPMVYSPSTSSRERSKEWKSMIPGDYEDFDTQPSLSEPLQQIFYGAPGTGKSHKIKEIIKEHGINEKEQVIRTTFHPDSDYSTFVGCYKPIMKSVPQTYVVEGNEKPVMADKNNQATKDEIVYDYTPQAFVLAYTKAWTTDEPVILVIEEINRGNCAQIFGDIFQLLDRGDDGVSEYEIKPDKALENYLKDYFAAFEDVDEQIKSGKIMKLPSNLYIWATMNTSDQSLFPIDSAFKRRWEWKYMPINDHKDKDYKIEIGNIVYHWWGFLARINQVIGDTTSSEDKKLGYFFAKAKDKSIDAEQFVGKVLFYLWNDVFKNYGFDNPIFSKGDKKRFEFSDFFMDDGKPNVETVNQFLKTLEENVIIENLPVKITDIDNLLVADDDETVNEEIKRLSKETLVSVMIPNNPIIGTENNTQFEAFVKAIDVIGIDRVRSVINSLKYRRLGCPVISTEPYPDIENNNSGYFYKEIGGLYIIKGCKNYTYIRILEDLDRMLNIGLSLVTK